MGLIDKERLKSRFKAESERFSCRRWDLQAIIDVIDDAPAIETLLAEREALLEHIRGDCDECVEASTPPQCRPCVECCYSYQTRRPKEPTDNWEWRGPTPTNHEAVEPESTDVCGATGLPCSQCQPGPCNSRVQPKI